MYTHCTTEKASNQQRLLEVCLRDCMLRQPYEEISVSALCQQTKLSRKTFYRLFGNKDDVLCALIDHTILECASFTPARDTLAPHIPEEIQRLFLYWYSHRELMDALVKNQKSSLLLERGIAHLQQEDLSSIHALGADNPYFGREIMVFFLCGIVSLVIEWHNSGYAKSPEEMAFLLDNLMKGAPTQF